MRHPVEGDEVVLAGGVQGDIADDNELVVVDIEGGREQVRGVLVESGEDLRVGAGYA
ncbi:hypothetical protein [Janibacter sp. GXQ6167]|uniref:hypothetical protein n=1 Tax=Janibacter sp. GXQ6167 TaxID=3240791 RepID=UPI003526A5DF